MSQILFRFRSIGMMICFMLFVMPCGLTAQQSFHYLPDQIGWHQAVYHYEGKEPRLAPWTTWDDALEREMNWYLNAPVNEHGYPSFVYMTFMDELYQPYKNEIIPATQDGMGIISYLKYWEYKGRSNPKVLEIAKKMGDYLVREANTPDKGVYPRFTRSTGIITEFPIVNSSQGDARYGKDVIEPDKGGVAGYALLQLYKVTKENCYLDQAVHNADVLSKMMRPGDATRSPWPFRVDAINGKYWGERSGNMVYILRLFDDLIETGMTRFQKPREALWSWILTYQLTAADNRENSLWMQFFEDQTVEDNRTAWAPLNMARYLIEKKEVLDPLWKEHAEACIQFALRHFGIERPAGVWLVGEQDVDRRAWGGINSTFGAVAAMFYAAGGGEKYRDLAFGNLSWMTYFIREDGVVCDQTGEWHWLREGGWQEDCHTDVIHNFMDALSAVPQWATSKNAEGTILSEKKDYFRQPRNGNVYVVAHRGAHNNIPENSLAAYQKAIDLGCDFVEIDVRTSKDGRFVSVHNSTIDAYVKGKSGKVKDMTFAELRALDIGARIGPQWQGTRIPSFEEILQLCRGQIGIYLDLKDAPVAELVKIINGYNMERDIIWYVPAAYMDAIKELKRQCYQCVPMPDPGPENNIAVVVEQIHPRVIASDMGELSEGFVKTAHANGVKVIVDENKGTPEEWRQILQWQTDGIQTDHPAELIEFLQKK